jgi:hypothetical protein
LERERDKETHTDKETETETEAWIGWVLETQLESCKRLVVIHNYCIFLWRKLSIISGIIIIRGEKLGSTDHKLGFLQQSCVPPFLMENILTFSLTYYSLNQSTSASHRKTNHILFFAIVVKKHTLVFLCYFLIS